MGTRTKWAWLGVAVGVALGVGGVAAYEMIAQDSLAPEAALRDRMWSFHEEARARFLDVPSGKIHLRAVPSRSDFLPGDVGTHGTMATAQDAHHEFFREETRRWFVRLYEAAVAQPGVLTLELVDRPGPDGTPRAVIARLQQRVEPQRALLLGLGFENLQARDLGEGGPRGVRKGSLGRIRLLAAGGKAVGDPETGVKSRLYTDTLTTPAWWPVHSTDVVPAEESRAALDGLEDAWVDGPDLQPRQHVAGSAGPPLVLGALIWLPKASGPGSVSGSHGSWVNGRIDDRTFSGDVSVRRTNDSITLSEGGKPVAFHAYSRPAWLVRVRFEASAP